MKRTVALALTGCQPDDPVDLLKEDDPGPVVVQKSSTSTLLSEDDRYITDARVAPRGG